MQFILVKPLIATGYENLNINPNFMNWSVYRFERVFMMVDATNKFFYSPALFVTAISFLVNSWERVVTTNILFVLDS